MKKLYHLSMPCLLALAIVGCEEPQPSSPQPVAGNEAPTFGPKANAGKKPGGAPNSLSNKTSGEP